MTDGQDTTNQSKTITHIILACDESGSKGYADRDEETPGETGVFAGIMVPAADVGTVAPDFDAAAKRYASVDGKLHITDLPPEHQQSLREEMFSLVRTHKLPCFYEAIHVAGFHRAHKQLRDHVEQARAARQSAIKLGGHAATPSSLHAALFQGLYSKILAFCLEREKTRLHIEVRTDRVDSTIVKNFDQEARELLNFGAKIRRVTGFDPKSKRLLEGSVEIGAVPIENQLPIIVEHLEITVVDDSDGLVVAADVLANSLEYLFRTRPPEERFRALNTPEAFARHLLRDCLDSFERWDGYNFTDSFYAHPLDPKL